MPVPCCPEPQGTVRQRVRLTVEYRSRQSLMTARICRESSLKGDHQTAKGWRRIAGATDMSHKSRPSRDRRTGHDGYGQWKLRREAAYKEEQSDILVLSAEAPEMPFSACALLCFDPGEPGDFSFCPPSAKSGRSALFFWYESATSLEVQIISSTEPVFRNLETESGRF